MKACILLAVFSSALAVTNYQKKCGQSPDGGPCRASLTMWWFNAVSGECEEFEYGGCGGNENRYEDRAECVRTCSKEKLHLRPKEVVRAVKKPAKLTAEYEANVCRRPPFSGPCTAYFPRFYYDALTKQCRPFVYGGCQSNGNNFETLRQCINLCATPAQGEPVPLVA